MKNKKQTWSIAVSADDQAYLRLVNEQRDQAVQVAQRASDVFQSFVSHLTTKYTLKEGDHIDFVTGAITRKK